MKKDTATILGMIFAALVINGLFALFVNWILSMIIVWPVTWGNWGITWGVIIILRAIFGKDSK